jgi:hypothetical protein
MTDRRSASTIVRPSRVVGVTDLTRDCSGTNRDHRIHGSYRRKTDNFVGSSERTDQPFGLLPKKSATGMIRGFLMFARISDRKRYTQGDTDRDDFLLSLVYSSMYIGFIPVLSAFRLCFRRK